MENASLERSVVQTLAYFSLFKYPLTREELFRYLWQPPAITYAEFSQWLASYAGAEFSSSQGFYFIPGREADIGVRQTAVADTEQKTRRAMRAVQYIRWVPFLRAVFICNSVAMNVASSESDIDVFIVTETQRTWFVRFMVTLVLSLFGLRRHGQKIADRICLSFYSDITHLNMEKVSLGSDDVYLAYWLVHLLPIWDPDGLYASILKRNLWIHKLVPHAQINAASPAARRHSLLEWLLARRFGYLLEIIAKNIQLHHMRKTSLGKDRPINSAVVIEDGFLKFHETDRREEFRSRWQQQYNNITI